MEKQMDFGRLFVRLGVFVKGGRDFAKVQFPPCCYVVLIPV